MEIRGLTLTEPWATLVVLGEKQIETRSWSTNYRGLLAIHAAKKFPAWARDTCLEEPFLSSVGPIPEYLGCILGVVQLAHISATERLRRYQLPSEKERAFGDYANGRFAWMLAGAKMLDNPIPCRGMLGLWKVPLQIAQQALEKWH